MQKTHSVKIESPNETLGTRVFLDGKELHDVCRVSYRIGTEMRYPQVNISVNKLPDMDEIDVFEVDGSTVNFGFTPNTWYEVMKVMNNLLDDPNKYHEVWQDIEREVKKEIDDEDTSYNITTNIMKWLKSMRMIRLIDE